MNYQLRIAWLYPELMSIYGDRGNVIAITKRCQWRRIACQVVHIDLETPPHDLASCDLVLGGGAQDRQQEIVISDLAANKAPTLRTMFTRGVPGLFVCGSPQLLGKYYRTADGKKLPGLGFFDFYTEHPGPNVPRCIGDTVAELSSSLNIHGSMSPRNYEHRTAHYIVGFENHGGRTYLGKDVPPFARVVRGSGNNGQDRTEGGIWQNVIACYYHGPLLPKNPHIADWLIAKALEVKYKKPVPLAPLPDTLEWQAHDFILTKLGII